MSKHRISTPISALHVSVLFVASLSYDASSAANAAGPTVNGNVISWTESGWHQVQVQGSYESVCEGGRQCTVPTGVYTVINHGTGERFNNIPVVDQSANDAPPAPVATTGQVVSYAFGDDGDYQSGVSQSGIRFNDNDDGTFTDTLTGVVWLSIVECITKRDWSGAVDYANKLSAKSDQCPELNDESVAGDWRLPNIKAIYTLVDISDNSPAWAEGIPYIGNFAEDPYDLYWSSSSFQPTPDINAWAINAGFGQTVVHAKNNVEWTWAIRDAR